MQTTEHTLNERDLDAVTRALRRQRAVLLGEVAENEADLDNLSEDRETEWSESGQKEETAHALGQLDVRDNEALAEVEAALQRIDDGTYGVCTRCGRTIPLERLHAIPTAERCAECEQAVETALEEEDIPESGRIPPDLSLLSNEELRDTIYDNVREDGRVDMEELQVTCRNGVVTLSGSLPSERERSIVLQLITDVLGLEEVVDHIQVESLPWQREERSKPDESLAQVRPSEADYGSDDVIESSEEVLREASPLGQPEPEEE